MAKQRARKTPTQRRAKTAQRKSATRKTINHETVQRALLTAYEELHEQVDRAWSKLKKDVARKAPQEVIMRDRNELALLLGECNYMEKETRRCASRC